MNKRRKVTLTAAFGPVVVLALCLGLACNRLDLAGPTALPVISGAAASDGLAAAVQTGAFVFKPIVGQVYFPEEDRGVQATMKDVAKAATVSLINASSNQTIATTLTNSNGAFSLDVKSIPGTPMVFYLEAAKGLFQNSVGKDTVRVRTFVTYDFVNQAWLSITNGTSSDKLRINTSTTALTIITSLRQDLPNSVTPANLIGRLTVTDGPPLTESFATSGTNIETVELDQVRTLVGSSLTADSDPYDAVLLKDGQYKLRSYVSSFGDPVSITFIYPTVASNGDYVEINGWGFTQGSVVKFGGVEAQIVSVSAAKMTVVVPEGAVSGPMYVETGNATGSTTISINQPVIGGFKLEEPAPIPTEEPTPIPEEG